MNTIYIATDTKAYGDSFDIIKTFNLEEAIEAAKADRAHLTDSERAKSTHAVSGFRAPVSTLEEWDEWYDEHCSEVDPCEYYEIEIED